MVEVTWNLPNVLKEHDISPYKLGQAAPRDKEQVVYKFAKNENASQIHLSSLKLVIEALDSLGVKVGIEDLIKVEHSS